MSNRMWKDGGRSGIAYVEEKILAQQLLDTVGETIRLAGKKTLPTTAARPATPGDAPMMGAMAVYVDHRGRPFAWQIRFPVAQWEQVVGIVAPVENPPASVASRNRAQRAAPTATKAPTAPMAKKSTAAASAPARRRASVSAAAPETAAPKTKTPAKKAASPKLSPKSSRKPS